MGGPWGLGGTPTTSVIHLKVDIMIRRLSGYVYCSTPFHTMLS